MRFSSSFFFFFLVYIYVYVAFSPEVYLQFSLIKYSISQSSFFAHFMCFEVPTLLPPEGIANRNKAGDDKDDADDDLGIIDIDENDNKAGNFSCFLLFPCSAWSL